MKLIVLLRMGSNLIGEVFLNFADGIVMASDFLRKSGAITIPSAKLIRKLYVNCGLDK